MAEVLPAVRLAAEVLGAASILGLLYRLDRFRAHRSDQKAYLEALLAKAERDRRATIVMHAADLAAVFQLDGRTLRDAREFAAKAARHPSAVRPGTAQRRRRLAGRRKV